MKKYCLVTTYYCNNCGEPNKEFLKSKFNYDGELEDIYVNFSNKFLHNDFSIIPNVGITKRKDLVYGKIFLLKEYVETNILNKYEYICHIDFSDTKFNSSYLEMMKKFEATNEDIVISTEKTIWPFIDELRKWTSEPLEEKEFTYLNSGAIIAKTDFFYKILCELIDICLTQNIDFWDDQGVWQYYDLLVSKLNKDYNCEYFFSTALLDDSYYILEEKKIKTKFNTIPFLIHDNSSFSLNLINMI
jgi:hypothetical protein